MITEKEETLQRCLNEVGLRELPKILSSTNANWRRAIALVQKVSGAQGYCLVKRGLDGSVNVSRTFGSMSAISEVKEIYPYDFTKAIIDMKKATAEEKAKILRRNGDNTWRDAQELTSTEGKTEEEVAAVDAMVVAAAEELAEKRARFDEEQRIKDEQHIKNALEYQKNGKQRRTKKYRAGN